MKKIALQFFGTVKEIDGKKVIVLDNPIYYTKYLSKTYQVGQKVIVGVRERKKVRTLKQQALWWVAVVSIIAEHTGDNLEDVHTDLKRLLLPKKVRTGIDGKVYRDVGSTTDLSTTEFSELVQKARAWAAQFLEITLPIPEEIEDSEEYEGISQ